MGLPSTYTNSYATLPDFFNHIRDAQAPEKFTNTILKDLGYKSNNHRPFIPLMKALGFLSSDGSPTKRYHDYRNHSLSRSIMGEAIKEAYSDIFLIKSHPTAKDKELIQGKFKSFHNAKDPVAALMTKTFFSLLGIADLEFEKPKNEKIKIEEVYNEPVKNNESPVVKSSSFGLHYNIQIHLPATKDVEVYNAIFKSLKEHLVE
ncbi:DUF5343 domain-containing protein [Flavobacterium sp. CFBP9031]|uniref:DUF5343 domain-containing protein n=1 Tax=Flavobacterium sp. CFBP9031 TaxID=3096538 RepID=UPI002A6A1347|nr:DUF5343 domain-containing protein [Flavobacterium sp. CFBP9031]MDY0988726.1 DUF5343 domain-containing protein [Flavobacterium sp. CFBP9031]